MALNSVRDRFPAAWRGHRSSVIPEGMSIWDVSPPSWDIDCSGCATSCVEMYDGECVFTPPDTPQIMIRTFCRAFPKYRGLKCGEVCSKERVCPYWLVRGSVNREPKTRRPVILMRWGDDIYFFSFIRRRSR